MARAVYLHIGTPKSGTTYLQRLLWTNKKRLATHGTLMAGNGRKDSLHAMMAIQQRNKLTTYGEEEQSAWPRLQAEAAEWDGDVIISHEFLGRATRKQASAAIAELAPADVHIVVTVRDYLAVIPGIWQESVKIGSADPFDVFVEKMLAGSTSGPWSWSTTDVQAVLDRWTGGVPPEHVHVVTVPPPGSAPDLLWQRFATACGLDPGVARLPDKGRNDSLGRAEAELLMRLDDRWPAEVADSLPERHRWVRGYLGQDVLVPSRSPRVTVPRAGALELRAKAAAAADHIRTHGFHVSGDLDDLTCLDVPPEGAPSTLATDEEVLDVALEAVVELLMRVREGSLDPEPPRQDGDSETSDGKTRRLSQVLRRGLLS